MRQLLVAFVATAALVASQNSAQAVFEKVIIDEFSLPNDGSQQSSGDLTSSPQALGLTSEVATNRTLQGVGGTEVIGLTVPVPPSTGEILQITLSPGAMVEAVYTLANGAFLQVDPVAFLTSVTQTSGSGDLSVRMLVDGTEYGTALHTAANMTSQDLQFVDLGLAGGTYSTISFQFQAIGGSWTGTVDNVVANPEPATMALMGLGVLGGAIGYRRRRKDDEVVPVEA